VKENVVLNVSPAIRKDKEGTACARLAAAAAAVNKAMDRIFFMKFSHKHGFPADCREHGGQPPLYLQAILIPTIKISFKTITWQKNSILWQTRYRFCVKFIDINY
jgi:hypothetical protein